MPKQLIWNHCLIYSRIVIFQPAIDLQDLNVIMELSLYPWPLVYCCTWETRWTICHGQLTTTSAKTNRSARNWTNFDLVEHAKSACDWVDRVWRVSFISSKVVLKVANVLLTQCVWKKYAHFVWEKVTSNNITDSIESFGDFIKESLKI